MVTGELEATLRSRLQRGTVDTDEREVISAWLQEQH